MFYKRIGLFLLTVVFAITTGCQNKALYNQSEANIADVKERTEKARQLSNDAAKPIPSLLIFKLGKSSMSLKRGSERLTGILWIKKEGSHKISIRSAMRCAMTTRGF